MRTTMSNILSMYNYGKSRAEVEELDTTRDVIRPAGQLGRLTRNLRRYHRTTACTHFAGAIGQLRPVASHRPQSPRAAL